MESEWFGQCTPCHQPFLTRTPPRINQLPLENSEEISTASAFGHTQQVNAICIYAANTRALSASGDGTLKVWDLNTYCVRHTLSGGHGGYSVLSCAVVNGTRALSGGADHQLRVWDLENHTLLGHPSSSGSNHTGSILCLEASSKGYDVNFDKCALFYSGSADGTIKKWKVSMDGVAIVLATMNGHEGPVRCLSLYDNDEKLVSGGSDGIVKLWDTINHECFTTLEGHTGSVNCCGISEKKESNLTMLITGSSDESLRVWDLEKQTCNALLHGHFDSVTCCHIFKPPSPSSSIISSSLPSSLMYGYGTMLLSGSLDETLKVWEIPTFLEKHCEQINGDPIILNCSHTLNGHIGGITSCMTCSDGLTALSGSYDKTMKVWDLPILL